MSTAKFSPGPWTVTRETRLHVATPGDLNAPLNPANAALIAAAPDLFAALDDLVHQITLNDADVHKAYVLKARNALRRAIQLPEVEA